MSHECVQPRREWRRSVLRNRRQPGYPTTSTRSPSLRPRKVRKTLVLLRSPSDRKFTFASEGTSLWCNVNCSLSLYQEIINEPGRAKKDSRGKKDRQFGWLLGLKRCGIDGHD